MQRASALGWGGSGRWRAWILAAAGVPQRDRAAVTLLEDEAATRSGRVFRMRGGDLVLLAPTGEEAFAQQFTGHLASLKVLFLPEQDDQLLAYARANDDLPSRLPASATGLRRQTAVIAGRVLSPCYQEVLPARPGARLTAEDLPGVLPQLATWTRLGESPALHLALDLPALLSPGFAALAAKAGLPVGASVPLIAAVADPDGWLEAAETARRAGVTLVLDRVSHAALHLIDPVALGPDLVKMTWSAEMIEGGPSLRAALGRIGPERVVLDGADTETAIRWGLSQGVRRFQGRHVDIMLATGRMAACFAGDACTVRQCADRAYATDPAGRAGCRNPVNLASAGAVVA